MIVNILIFVLIRVEHSSYSFDGYLSRGIANSTEKGFRGRYGQPSVSSLSNKQECHYQGVALGRVGHGSLQRNHS